MALAEQRFERAERRAPDRSSASTPVAANNAVARRAELRNSSSFGSCFALAAALSPPSFWKALTAPIPSSRWPRVPGPGSRCQPLHAGSRAHSRGRGPSRVGRGATGDRGPRGAATLWLPAPRSVRPREHAPPGRLGRGQRGPPQHRRPARTAMAFIGSWLAFWQFGAAGKQLL